MSIAFDEEVVGSFGAGFAWHGPTDEQSVLHQAAHDGDSEAGDFMQVHLFACSSCYFVKAVSGMLNLHATTCCVCRMR